MDLKLKKGTQIPKPGDPIENSGIVVAEATQRHVTTRGGRRSRGEYLSQNNLKLSIPQFPSGLLKYVVIGGKKAFRAESGLIWDLFWTR